MSDTFAAFSLLEISWSRGDSSARLRLMPLSSILSMLRPSTAHGMGGPFEDGRLVIGKPWMSRELKRRGMSRWGN